MTKIFAVSDIHGHYTELVQALNDCGYDSNNKDHLLVVCGDMFDRGRESFSVYTFLKKLADENKAVIIKGNHEPMFTDWLKGDNNPFNYQHNGTNETIDDFVHSTSDFKMYMVMHPEETDINTLWHNWCTQARAVILKENPGIIEWLENLPDYYETENYIFTHGSIDGQCPDWHFPHKDIRGRYIDWEACAWDDGSFFNSSIVNTDKTVVIGHFSTGHLRELYNIGDENDYSILIRNDNKVIAIDACTILTKKINVLVIDNEKLLDKEKGNE